MDAPVCARVFDYKFSTARRAGASTEEANGMKFSGGAADGKLCGFGYGLPLARVHARLFGGDLAVVSSPGNGTEVALTLAADAAEARENLGGRARR